MKNNPSFSNIVFDFITYQSTNSMKSLISYVKGKEIAENEMAELAISLAKTGKSIIIDKRFDLYDIPSTGGPSSLSTLLGPLFLSCLNMKVLKIGVPGRPAGGVDCLAQIKSYDINIAPDKLNDKLKKYGYVHLITNSDFVPLDGKFFKFRKKNKAVDIPSLVIPSILSKKIAAGIKNVGLDIRVSTFGNFGNSWKEARLNAKKFISVSSLLGIRSICFLSNGDKAQQPYIGRGESLVAMSKIFNNEMNASLESHYYSCHLMAKSLAGNEKKKVSPKEIKNAFFENLQCQNGDKDSFYEIVNKVEKKHIYKIIAPTSGYLKVNLEQIRKSIILIQEKFKQEFSDPCGIILKAEDGSFVYMGMLLCTFRCELKFKKLFELEIEKAFLVSTCTNQIYDLEIIK